MKIKLISIVTGVLLLFAMKLHAAPPVDEGETIFTARCMACHKIDKDFAGPALANVDQRHTMDWIISFVHSSQTVIKSGDENATALFEKFNKVIMPDHPDLSDDNIKSIVHYIKEESQKISSAPKAPFAKPYELQPNYSPLSSKNMAFIVSYIIAVTALIMVLLFAVHVKQLERKMHEQ